MPDGAPIFYNSDIEYTPYARENFLPEWTPIRYLNGTVVLDWIHWLFGIFFFAVFSWFKKFTLLVMFISSFIIIVYFIITIFFRFFSIHTNISHKKSNLPLFFARIFMTIQFIFSWYYQYLMLLSFWRKKNELKTRNPFLHVCLSAGRNQIYILRWHVEKPVSYVRYLSNQRSS